MFSICLLAIENEIKVKRQIRRDSEVEREGKREFSAVDNLFNLFSLLFQSIVNLNSSRHGPDAFMHLHALAEL